MASGEVDSSIPSWYCPFKLPLNLLGSFHPVIYLVGLDTASHRDVLETLTLQNVTKNIRPQFKVVPYDHPFRSKKLKSSEVELAKPEGILKATWVEKHLDQIPCVAIIFFDYNWTSTEWNVRKVECAQRIKALKTQVNPYGTQVLVMLVKSPGVEQLSSEKASAFCASADILPKFLYVLESGHLDKIHMCLQRLEYESEMFYKARVKKLKIMKEKAVQTPLIVRYNFKIAFFQEIRSDLDALDHYQAANEALLNIKVTEANVQELKVIASVLMYRICRLYVLNGNPKEAKAQFEKIVRAFYKLEGNEFLKFEHYAWLENQYHLFGDLLKLHYKAGAIFPDPVGFFLDAARYAAKRKQLVGNLNLTGWPTELLGFKKDIHLLYLGQRPWRQDSFSLENVFVVEDPSVVSMLQHLESCVNHSALVVNHLGVASDFCKVVVRRRTRCELMAAMAKEFYASGDYKNTVMLISHVLREICYSKWQNILSSLGELGMNAALREGDVGSFLYFVAILLMTDVVQKSQAAENLWNDFESVLQGKLPNSAQSVDVNKENWNANLQEVIVVRVEAFENSFLDFFTVFSPECVQNQATLKFNIRNKSDREITISKVGIARCSIAECNNLEKSCATFLQPGEETSVELNIKILPRDAGKMLQILSAFVGIGSETRCVLLHSSIGTTSLEWASAADVSKRGLASIKLEAILPKLEAKVKREKAALLQEWYCMNIHWTNRETYDCNKMQFSYQVVGQDPQSVIVTFEPHSKLTTGQKQCTKKVEKLSAGNDIEHIVYFRTVNPVDREIKFLIESKYFDTNNQSMAVKFEESIQVLHPFKVSQTLLNSHANVIQGVTPAPGYRFMLIIKLKNIVDLPLILNRVDFVPSNPNLDASSSIDDQIEAEGILLGYQEEAEFQFLLGASRYDGIISGAISVKWHRQREDNSDLYLTNFEVPSIPMPLADWSLYLHADVPSSGWRPVLRTPFRLVYKLENCESRVLDLVITMDSTETFMNAGPKKNNLKVHPKEGAVLSYILFPLVTGNVSFPKPQIELSETSDTGAKTTTSVKVDMQDLPSEFYVWPN